jgi:hypothetical protein
MGDTHSGSGQLDMEAVTRAFTSGSSGRWAGEQMLKAVKAGIPLTASVLRTNDTLRHEEWKAFDDVVMAEALIRLRGVADLIANGLSKPIANSLGKTVFAYEKMTFMDPATVSMDGVTRTENDRQEFEMAQLPLPITHKDFWLNLRTLMGSRERGESLDTTQSRTAGRVCAEMAEQMLFQGGKTFGALPIYGYMTEPHRNTMSYGANGAWSAAGKTGADFLADVLAMVSLANAKRMFGPYRIYVPSNASVALSNDFKALGTLTVKQRLLMVDQIQDIVTVDQLPSGNVIMVQMTADVVEWLQGETLQTIQWDVEGGFRINFKAFQIGVPLVKADVSGRSGIVHVS